MNVAQLRECLLSMYSILGSIPSKCIDEHLQSQNVSSRGRKDQKFRVIPNNIANLESTEAGYTASCFKKQSKAHSERRVWKASKTFGSRTWSCYSCFQIFAVVIDYL